MDNSIPIESPCRSRRQLLNFKIFSGLLLLGTLVLGVFLSLGMLNLPSAAAAIRQLEEAPGQIIYQSRQTLKGEAIRLSVPTSLVQEWQTISSYE